MDIKQTTKDRMELRIHADETLKGVMAWISAVRPSEWLPPTGKDSVMTQEQVNAQWREYVDQASNLVSKLWKPADLMIDDLTAYMEEICAKPKQPPSSD